MLVRRLLLRPYPHGLGNGFTGEARSFVRIRLRSQAVTYHDTRPEGADEPTPGILVRLPVCAMRRSDNGCAARLPLFRIPVRHGTVWRSSCEAIVSSDHRY